MNWLPGMDRTIVIDVHGKRRSELIKIPNFVYVGRKCGEWPESIWGNPFRLDGSNTIDDIIYSYEFMIRRNDYLMSRIHELRNKTLGCWCANWNGVGQPRKKCHAVVLATIAYER